MDGFCKRTILLVFTVGAVIKGTIQDSKAEPVVPATVEVCSGFNATINCTFTADSEDLKIKWHFNSLSSESKIDDNNKHYDLKHGKTWSALTIKEVTLNDSGLYFCVVTKDIPILQKYYNSSQLKVYVGVVNTKAEPVVAATVEVCSGFNATINCTFTADSDGLKMRWHFNSLSSESKIDDNNKHYDLKHGKTWSALTIKEVTFNDSGLYFCVVTQGCPILMEYYSNGSLLIVNVKAVSDNAIHDTRCEPVVPRRVDMCAGSNASINCTFTTDYTHLKVTWLKSNYKESTVAMSPIQNKYYLHSQIKTWSELTVINAKIYDSGWYFCNVKTDIPRCMLCLSNGAQLNVIGNYASKMHGFTESFCIASEALSSVSATLIWSGSALGFAVLVIVTAVIWRMRKRDSHYENTRTYAKKHENGKQQNILRNLKMYR